MTEKELSKNLDDTTYGFDRDRAAKCFYELASHYYDRNFGRIRKEDVDLLMFGFYDKAHSSKEEGRQLSDYAIGLRLGLDAAAVQRRRSKHLLVYGDESERENAWILELARTIKNKSYRNEEKSITIKFPSQTICDEFQDYMEKNNVYSDCRFGSCRVTMDRRTFQTIVAKRITDDYANVIGDERLDRKVRLDQICQAVHLMLGKRVGCAVDEIAGENVDACIEKLCDCVAQASGSVIGAGHLLLHAVVDYFKGEGCEGNGTNTDD